MKYNGLNKYNKLYSGKINGICWNPSVKPLAASCLGRSIKPVCCALAEALSLLRACADVNLEEEEADAKEEHGHTTNTISLNSMINSTNTIRVISLNE